MRSLFDRGPNRQGGTMRGAGGMGFINRGSSLGTGIDYGTFSGPGAGGARFYGEGVVHLKRGGTAAAAACPFDVSLQVFESAYKIKVEPGTVNGLYATNYAGCLSFASTSLSVAASGTTNVVVDVTTDGKQVTAFSMATLATMSAISPTTPLAPTNFKWPVAHIKNGVVYKTIGCGSLVAQVKENVRVARSPETADDNAFDIFYYWVMSVA